MRHLLLAICIFSRRPSHSRKVRNNRFSCTFLRVHMAKSRAASSVDAHATELRQPSSFDRPIPPELRGFFRPRVRESADSSPQTADHAANPTSLLSHAATTMETISRWPLIAHVAALMWFAWMAGRLGWSLFPALLLAIIYFVEVRC